MDQYVHLIQSTLDDVFDLAGAIEYDEEFMGDAEKIIEPLRTSLNALLKDIEVGTYEFANEDLAFMQILQGRTRMALPFGNLLRLINTTHRNGFATD